MLGPGNKLCESIMGVGEMMSPWVMRVMKMVA